MYLIEVPMDIVDGQIPAQPMNVQESSYSGWAIAAMIFAFIAPLIGLILAIVALVVIKDNPSKKGKGLAIAALIISIVFMVLFLLVIAAIAYFGVLSPANLLPQKCEFEAGLDCIEHPEANEAAGTIAFPVYNSLGYTIRIDSVKGTVCGGGGTTVNGQPLPVEVKNGEQAAIILGDCDFGRDERYDEDITITYTSMATNLQHKGTGTVAGKVE
jgi:hypothetical protein